MREVSQGPASCVDEKEEEEEEGLLLARAAMSKEQEEVLFQQLVRSWRRCEPALLVRLALSECWGDLGKELCTEIKKPDAKEPTVSKLIKAPFDYGRICLQFHAHSLCVLVLLVLLALGFYFISAGPTDCRDFYHSGCPYNEHKLSGALPI